MTLTVMSAKAMSPSYTESQLTAASKMIRCDLQSRHRR